jgi:hypothetical protein
MFIIHNIIEIKIIFKYFKFLIKNKYITNFFSYLYNQ